MKDAGQMSLAGLCAGGGALSLAALAAAWVFSPVMAPRTVSQPVPVAAIPEDPSDWSGAVDAAWQPLHTANETRTARQVSLPVPVDWVATSFGARESSSFDRDGDSSDFEAGAPTDALVLEASAEPVLKVSAEPMPAVVDDSDVVAAPLDDPFGPFSQDESVSLPGPGGADGQVRSDSRLEESAPRWVAAMGVARESGVPIETPAPEPVVEPRPIVIQLDRSRDLSAPLWRPGVGSETGREAGRPRVVDLARLDARRDRYRAVVRWARLRDVLERLADLSGRRLETTLELAEVVSLDRADTTLDELLAELAGVAGYAVEVTPGALVVRVHAVALQPGRE